MSEQVILNIAGVNKRFGGLQALTDVGIKIMQGQIYGLIGPNGAGKTTFFNVITGLYQPDTGTFELAGKPYSPSAPHEVAKAGIARTFQNIRLFGEMTALENVMVGRHVRSKQGVFGAIFRHKAAREEEADIRRRFWVALALSVVIVLLSPMGTMLGLAPLPLPAAMRSFALRTCSS